MKIKINHQPPSPVWMKQIFPLKSQFFAIEKFVFFSDWGPSIPPDYWSTWFIIGKLLRTESVCHNRTTCQGYQSRVFDGVLLIFPGTEWRGALEWEITAESDVRHPLRVDHTETHHHYHHQHHQHQHQHHQQQQEHSETTHIGPQPSRLVWRETAGDQTDRTELWGLNSSYTP